MGVEIDNKLSFGEHVKIICKKANIKLRVLTRATPYMDMGKWKHLLDLNTNFNYCLLIWVLPGPTTNWGGAQGDYSSTLLFLKSYFGRDVFLEIRFCFVLQGIQNVFGSSTPRISLQFSKIKYIHERCLRVCSLVVSDLRWETKGSWLESDCRLMPKCFWNRWNW